MVSVPEHPEYSLTRSLSQFPACFWLLLSILTLRRCIYLGVSQYDVTQISGISILPLLIFLITLLNGLAIHLLIRHALLIKTERGKVIVNRAYDMSPGNNSTHLSDGITCASAL
jgi:hypothetical protein